MRIVIAAVSSNRSMSGVSRHAANLVKCLLSRHEISSVHVLVGKWEQGFVREAIARQDARLHVHGVAVGAGTVSRNVWYYRALPAIAMQLRADLVHLAYPSPIESRGFPCPVVTTLHDLYPYDIPSNFGFPKVLFNRMILKQCLRNADAIACVSDSTKLQLGLRMPQLLPKAVTINTCVESARIALRPSFAVNWSDRPFLLCVAQHRRNKNIPVALAAFRILLSKGAVDSDARFLLIGMEGPETGRIAEIIRQLRLEQRVILADGISESEMNWCYRNCEVLLAPSIVEGFGLPIIEGRLAGCRIVCSDIAAFREVGGAGCRYVELGREGAKAFAVAVEASLRERRPLPARLSSLSPTTVAPEYLRLYRKLVESRGVASSQVLANGLNRPEQGNGMETKAAV
jgi:glycosyltransferase involved in cell wall biosynthesis